MNEKKHSLMKNYFSLTKLEHIPRSIPLFLRYLFLFVFSQHIYVCVWRLVCCCFFNSIVPFDVLFHWWSFNFDTYPKLFFFSRSSHIYFSLFLHYQHISFSIGFDDELFSAGHLYDIHLYLFNTLHVSCLCAFVCVLLSFILRLTFINTLTERFWKKN